MYWLHLAVLAPFLTALLVPFLYKMFRFIHTGWFVLSIPLLLFFYFISYIPVVRAGETVQASIPWIPSFGIHFNFFIDGLSLLFSLLISGMGVLVILYSIYYLSKKKEAIDQFYIYLLLFMGAMLGLVLSDNLIALYLFWEVTSVASFLLIAYWHKREKSRYGAQKSLLITIFGGLAMLSGFILLYNMTGTFSIREVVDYVVVFQQSGVMTSDIFFIPAMLLILIGAFTKSAQFPFHIWLPDAMEAPTPVSAYLHSATMVKAGIYLVARLSPIFSGHAEWFWIISSVGMITFFWGSFSALRQTDLKSILAFSTVGQLGLIMSLLGLGYASIYFGYGGDKAYTIATLAAIFHLINHALFKGALFMVVGIVDHETGTRDINQLGGLAKYMPITFTLALIGSFAMAGLPLLNGFLSKELFFTGVLNASELQIWQMDRWGFLFPVFAWIASIFTFIYCLVLVMKPFMGRIALEKLKTAPHEAPFGMLLSPIILASFIIIFFFFPNLLSYRLIEPAMASILPSLLLSGEQFDINIYFWHGWTMELYMTIGVIVAGTILYLLRRRWIALFTLFPKRLTLNKLYDHSLIGLERASKQITQFHMTGFIRDYLVYILTFFLLMIGGTLLWQQAIHFSGEEYAPVSLYEVILAIVMVVAAMVVLLSSHRLTAIIAIGIVGYVIAIFFVIFRAPDLALTQLVIESVSVALFLLCFYHLPKLKRERSRVRFRLTNLFISLGVGMIVTIMALSSHSSRLFEPISSYFVQSSYEEAGGKNIVNVILVDFRGFDTLFEIVVLTIAALGIYAIIKLRLNKKEEAIHEDK